MLGNAYSMRAFWSFGGKYEGGSFSTEGTVNKMFVLGSYDRFGREQK